MGGLIAIVLAVGLPPMSDGAACEAWVSEHARELAIAPQPLAAALGPDGPGLADLDPRIWTAFVSETPQSTPENRDRFAAALDGRTAISTVPELVDAARRVEPALHTLLTSARGARNALPPSLQLWATLDSPRSPSGSDLQAGLRLGLVRGRVALSSHEVPRAVETCVGLLGLLRASAGTSLVGRMVARAWGTRTRALCLETAGRASPAQREELWATVMSLSAGWPDFAHTLGQEMVFGQLVLFSGYWSDDNRSRLPPEAVHLRQAAVSEPQASSWQRFRRELFGRWTAREQCLLFARALALVDAPPSIADPALHSLEGAPLVWRLADFPPTGAEGYWVGIFRRLRSLETDLAFLRAGLAAWEFRDRTGAWPASLESLARDGRARANESGWRFVDARTGQPLILEVGAPGVFLVARADSSREAEGVRVSLVDAREPGPR